ncbi:MAG: amylo-alpha-1,6-glucosidase [Breznakibacter sp.]
MAYFELDKSKLINLEYSLFREIIRTNRAGAYSSTSIVGCNTRKYHGLLVVPIDHFDYERYVMLSNLDISVIQHDKIFNLGIHKYQGNHYDPKGHKYIRNFEIENIPKITYRVGGVILSSEMVLVEKENQVLMRYTLEEAHSPTTLRFKPYLAFRSVHQLTHENMEVNTHFDKIENGIRFKLYEPLPELNLQVSKKNDFVPIPDWYRNIEYIKEYERGYDYLEDLYVPGYFEVPIEKGESVVFSASTEPGKTSGLKAKFTRESNKRIPRDTLLNNLLNSAQQFILKKGESSELVAGYHWYGSRLRDTFIALPGLSLYQKDLSAFKEILETSVKRLHEKLQSDCPGGPNGFRFSDTPLWFFYTLQECAESWQLDNVWKSYGKIMTQILEHYKNAHSPTFHIQENGLLYAKENGKPLTWMNAVVEGRPVTPRYGMPVELNALWYNALCFVVNQATLAGDRKSANKWKPLAELVGKSFVEFYWNDKLGYLADGIDGATFDFSIRPNQLFAVALGFSPLNDEQKKSVIDILKKELLTPKGLRTLSPSDPAYRGSIERVPFSRDMALHQGCVWPWLFGFFADAYLKIHKRGGLPFIKRIMEGFEEEMYDHCLGTIPEFFTGTPPHKGKGAVSMAWNVAAILKVIKLTEKYS